MNAVNLTYKMFLVSIKRSYKAPFCRFQSLLSNHTRSNMTFLIGLVPVIPSVVANSGTEEVINNKTFEHNIPKRATIAKENETAEDSKTGWDRVCDLYKKDEYGNLSKELTATIQSVYFAAFMGLVYGGISASREALVDFMKRNQASVFENHLDAKRRLQNHVTIHFAKGAFRWGVKLSAFTGGFMLFLTSAAAYRGYYNVLDYTLSGAVVGSLLRFRIGPPAMVVGGTVGGVLGTLCGISTTIMLSLAGSTLDEVIAFQYEIDRSRNDLFHQAVKEAILEESTNSETLAFIKSRDLQETEAFEK